MLKSLWVALALLALTPAASAAAPERWVAHQRALVTIGPDGRVQEAELVKSGLSPAMQQELLQRVRKASFEPATVSGAPVVARTGLNLRLVVDAKPEGLALLLDSIDISASVRQSSPPRYPPAQLRAGKGAVVSLRIDYDAQGRVTQVEPAESGARADSFFDAASKAARRWVMEPEQVAGHGVAGSAIVPVAFSVEGSDDNGELTFPDGGVLVVHKVAQPQYQLLTSQVRLRSLEGAL